MAERRPLVLVSGEIQELPTGDTLPGASSLQNNYAGTAAPTITDDSGSGYAVGSQWVDVTNDKAYVCADDSVGAAVWLQTNGADGTDGNTVLYGTGDPTTEGVDGDFYINITSNTIFGPKASGTWPTGVSLVGPQGPVGPQGIQGPSGLDGADGSDGAQGPKGDTGDTGPQGPQGIQGIQGETGPQGSQGPVGPAGADGEGVPVGGTTGQVLSKVNATDFNTEWVSTQSSPLDNTSGALLKVGASATVLSASPALRMTYGGTANAITLTTGASLTALVAGQELRFRATAANTGATTINVDSIGPVAAKTVTGAALPNGYIRTDVDTVIRSDGTGWVVLPSFIPQSSVTDATPGAQMINGAWGVGNTGHLNNIGDWNATDKPGGLYLFSVATSNLGSKPGEYVDGNFGVVRIDRYSADYFTQTCWRVSGDALPFMRRWQSGIWTAWERVFISSNTVGTVAQSGGVPTEAIVERGSNANGSYTRWADGTQICFGTIAPDFTSTANQTFSFPAAFSATPRGRVGGISSGSATAIANEKSLESSGASGTTSFRATLDGTGTNGAGAEYQLAFNFMGRWF